MATSSTPLPALMDEIGDKAQARGMTPEVLAALLNADAETVQLSADPHFLALIERARARQKEEGGITSEEMRRMSRY